MKLDGAQVIAADRMTVWKAINDPEILQRCISGCEEMTRTSPTQYDAIVKQKIGPVSATFNGVVTLSDVREGESLRLYGEGKGGVAGMAKGGAVVTLTDVPGGTQLSYDAEASVAGKLAQLGSRLIDGVAQKMVNGFFANFKNEVEAAGSGSAGAGIVSSGTGASGGVSATASSHDSGAQGAAMAATAAGAAGAAGVAGAVASASSSASASASAHAGGAVETVRSSVDAHTGALHDAAADRMLNPAIGAGAGSIDMDDPDIGDIDVSSVEGGPAAEIPGSAADAQPQATAYGNRATDIPRDAMDTMRDDISEPMAEAIDATSTVDGVAPGMATPEGHVEAGDSGLSGAGMAAGAAAVGGIGAAVSGFAARAQDHAEGAHNAARERVIAAGGDVDEAKSWGDTKEHLGRAGSEARDTAQDVYDAARARIDGDVDRANTEWGEAKTNASDTYRELKGAGEDGWTTAKGYAAEEAKAPRIGPFGQPWYLWIIGIIVLLVILWIL